MIFRLVHSTFTWNASKAINLLSVDGFTILKNENCDATQAIQRKIETKIDEETKWGKRCTENSSDSIITEINYSVILPSIHSIYRFFVSSIPFYFFYFQMKFTSINDNDSNNIAFILIFYVSLSFSTRTYRFDAFTKRKLENISEIQRRWFVLRFEYQRASEKNITSRLIFHFSFDFEHHLIQFRPLFNSQYS